uniref:Uncharacterized protein n=1 Tax=Triticum urartu TaxID=4572 RepID=A0A8R7UJJ5_TRIUA
MEKNKFQSCNSVCCGVTFGSSENLQEYSELTKIIIQGKNHANSLLCIWD